MTNKPVTGSTAHLFKPTVRLNDYMRAVLTSGQRTLPRGQWVEDEAGRRGRFIAATEKSVRVAWTKPGETMAQQIQRFARAVWHTHYKHGDPVEAVLKAPKSVTLEQLQEHFRKAFAAAAKN